MRPTGGLDSVHVTPARLSRSLTLKMEDSIVSGFVLHCTEILSMKKVSKIPLLLLKTHSNQVLTSELYLTP